MSRQVQGKEYQTLTAHKRYQSEYLAGNKRPRGKIKVCVPIAAATTNDWWAFPTHLNYHYCFYTHISDVDKRNDCRIGSARSRLTIAWIRV